MNRINVASFGTDLSSRPRGGKLRRMVLESDKPVIVDFSGVRSVSHSFADEAIAVLAAEKGEEWFRSNVVIINHDHSVRLSLLEAIVIRQDRVNV